MIRRMHNLIEYYGNPAGFIKDGKAVVDIGFICPELNDWLDKHNLETELQKDVFSKLIANQGYYSDKDAEPLMNVRIWQINSNISVDTRFLALEDMRQIRGEPTEDIYHIIYDGDLQTNDLEKIYDICNSTNPDGYSGYSLAISDVIELYDEKSRKFYYIDKFGFKEIDFLVETKGFTMKHKIIS